MNARVSLHCFAVSRRVLVPMMLVLLCISAGSTLEGVAAWITAMGWSLSNTDWTWDGEAMSALW